jgi:hypothetical protein
MNLDNLDKFLEKVPMHYGEAIQLYPWIKETDCEDYEWCNRTSLENAIWLIEQMELLLFKYQSFQANIYKKLEHDNCHNCGDPLYPNAVSGYCYKCM